MPRKAIFVLGMHRSGTSAAAGVLARLGVSLGSRLYAAQSGVNEKGFWEHADIASTHDDVYRRIGSYWDDILPLPDGWWDRPSLDLLVLRLQHFVARDFRNAPVWGLKDPRICRLLPLWSRVLEPFDVEAGYLFVLRHPEQVVRSLQLRDGFSERKALLLWLLHNIEAERETRGRPRALISFDELLARPQDALYRIEEELQVRFPVAVERALPDLQEFLNPGLRHHGNAADPGEEPLAAVAQRVFEAMQHGGGREESHGALDDAAAELTRITAAYDPVLVEQLRSVSTARGSYEQLFLDAYRSVWWKLTWPLRAGERRARQLARRRWQKI